MPLRADLSQRFGFPVRKRLQVFCPLGSPTVAQPPAMKPHSALYLAQAAEAALAVPVPWSRESNGLPGEVGHIGIPMRLAARMNLPSLRCGWRSSGVLRDAGLRSRYVRLGPGHHWRESEPRPDRYCRVGGQQAMQWVFDAWLDLVRELLHTIQLTIDRHCVVLGGGLSRINGVNLELSKRFHHRAEKAFENRRFLLHATVKVAARAAQLCLQYQTDGQMKRKNPTIIFSRL